MFFSGRSAELFPFHSKITISDDYPFKRLCTIRPRWDGGQGAPFCRPFVILLLSHYPFIVQSELSLIISTKGPAPFSSSPICLKGQCHEIFNIKIFSLISSSKPLSLPLGPYQQHQRYWWQICRRCRWYRWCTLTCKYLREFWKNFEMALMLFSGAWRKMIHERKLKQKVSWHCPFKYNIYYFAGCLTSMRLILRSRSIVTLT